MFWCKLISKRVTRDSDTDMERHTENWSLGLGLSGTSVELRGAVAAFAPIQPNTAQYSSCTKMCVCVSLTGHREGRFYTTTQNWLLTHRGWQHAAVRAVTPYACKGLKGRSIAQHGRRYGGFPPRSKLRDSSNLHGRSHAMPCQEVRSLSSTEGPFANANETRSGYFASCARKRQLYMLSLFLSHNLNQSGFVCKRCHAVRGTPWN